MKIKRIILILLVFSFPHILSAQIIQAEYFWGSDPGQGSATTILAADGNLDNIVESLLTNAATDPGVGMHKFSIRVKDEQNNWGPVFTTVISVENTDLSITKNIIQAEWFWNTDPGAGSGNVILALDGNLNNVVESLLKTDLQCPGTGLNRFNIRIKDVQGNWGPVFTMVVSCENNILAEDQKVSQAEWFWGSDPGQGSGNAMLAFDGNFSDAYEALLQNGINCPGIGLNKFNIRIKDAQNSWGPVFTWIISCENLTAAQNQKISEAEWYWNSDPGQGNANPILAMDGNFSDVVETLFSSSITPPSPGLHKLCIRVKDFAGSWGPVFTYIVSYENTLLADNQKLIQAEYFWDSDPGQGAAYPIMTFDGSFDNVFEYIFDAGIATNGITAGHHLFSIRIKDNQNNWGPVFKQAIFFEDCPAPVINIGNDTTLCDASTINLNAGAGFDSYLWNNGATTQSIVVSTPGVYSVTAVHSSGCTRTDAVNISAQLYANLGNDITNCPNETVILNPGVFDAYLWTGGTTNPTYTVNPSSTTTYGVTVNDNGCYSNDQITVNVNTLPVIGYTGDDEVCMGEQTTLTGIGAVTYTWSGGVNNGMPFTPSATTVYTLNGEDANGCSSEIYVTVTVNDLPTVGFFGDTDLCESEQTTLSGTGALTYLWDNGVMDGVAFTPQPPFVYTVTGTDGNGCTSTVVATLTVNSLPVVTLELWWDVSPPWFGADTLCFESWSYQINGGSPSGGTFSGTGVTGDYFNPDMGVTPQTWNYITYTYTDFSGCVNYATDSVFTDYCMGISNNKLSDIVKVFPNPAKDAIYIYSELPINGTSVLTSSDGRVLQTTECNGNVIMIDISTYSKGIYFLKVINGNNHSVFRVVVE